MIFMKQIAVIPIDNRPICYTLIEQISAINKNMELYLPERKFLGGLYDTANISAILEWLKSLPKVDYMVISLDTIAYGGLVPSRRTSDSYDEIKKKLDEFKKAIKALGARVFAFSSIMRISNNNINEEEKEYWNPWGKRIFEYSYHQHKSRALRQMNCVINTVPADILEDYLNTRKRNFEINRMYLNWLSEGILDTLVYSKDDTGEYGLNVEEAQTLEREAFEKKLNAVIKTGADEIPLTLLAKAIAENENVKIKPLFVFEDSKGLISKYEDISVENCVKSQLSLAGVEVDTSQNPEITMVINNFAIEQGDLVLGNVINSLSTNFEFPKTPYFIADINNANGADGNLTEKLMNEKLKIGALLGYSAYNTSANTIGSSVCIALNTALALKYGHFNEAAFKKLMAIRFLDDWAYQANIRKAVRAGNPDFETALCEHISDFHVFEEKISKFLDYKFEADYSLPWKRSFEIEINLTRKD